jgi:hypothetical protein
MGEKNVEKCGGSGVKVKSKMVAASRSQRIEMQKICMYHCTTQ